ncbi:MAG: VanZ family protein [Bacteroidetes bacterium]|nr:VanZ family protein [Bacteroidota bacterium]
MKKLKKYLAKIYPAVTWTLIIFILLALPGQMLPKEQGFTIPNFDKVVHMGLFAGFVLLWCLYYSAKPLPTKKLLRIFFFIFIIGSAYGIGMEYVQKYFIPFRDFDTGDIIFDLIGSGIGYGVSNVNLIK